MGAAFAVENATVVSKMPFEVGELHALGNFEGFPNGLRGEIFFGELALSVEHELQCLAKIGLGFVQSFALRNCRGNLFDEGGVAALFGGFEYSSQFHGLRVSQVCWGCRTWNKHPTQPKDGWMGHAGVWFDQDVLLVRAVPAPDSVGFNSGIPLRFL